MDKTNDIYSKEIIIDFKKIVKVLWYRSKQLIKIFSFTLLFFIFMTFILPKKYMVDTDLYINKSNNSNLAEINPYVIQELGAGGMSSLLASGNNALNNEIEFIKSPLVLDNVIRENNIRVNKLYGIIKTKKYGQYVKADRFAENISIENKKGTNILKISYKSKNKKLAYNVVSSIINNYVDLHKQLNVEKSKSDIKILEAEYDKAKEDLNKNINKVNGLPATAMSGVGNLSAMSAFSKSAQMAMSNIQSQFKASEKSQIAVQEETAKLTTLASKLEWAKLVKELSDSSNVIVIKEPILPQYYEQVSPKLFKQIILGIIFGIIFSIIGIFYIEIMSKNLTYSMLGENVIYDLKKEFNKFKSIVYKNGNKKCAFIFFENLSNDLVSNLQEFSDVQVLKADISKEFANRIHSIDSVIFLEKINETDSEQYKLVKNIIVGAKKEIIAEVLL